MKRQVLFVQGGGEGTHDSWDNRLVDSLRAALGADYEISYPRMPHEQEPSYRPWKEAIAREIAALSDGAILVGHSIGATILINSVAEDPPPCILGGIMLVAAPFVGPGGWPSEEIALADKLGARLPEGVPVFFYHGGDDETAPPGHADLYERAIPAARVRRLAGRDHQLNNDLGEVADDIRTIPAHNAKRRT